MASCAPRSPFPFSSIPPASDPSENPSESSGKLPGKYPVKRIRKIVRGDGRHFQVCWECFRLPPGGGCGKLLFGKRRHPFLSLSGCFARAPRARCRKNFPAARSVPCPAQPAAAPPSFFRLRNFLPRFFTGGARKGTGCRKGNRFPKEFSTAFRDGKSDFRSFPAVRNRCEAGNQARPSFFHRSFPQACGKVRRLSFPKSEVFHSLLKLLLINVKDEK